MSKYRVPTERERQILIRSYSRAEREEPRALRDLDAYGRKVLRHEIIHAFLYESGLSCNSQETTAWAANEEMVDWFAIQGPKIVRAWREAGPV